MARASLNGVILADSDMVEIIEGCLYFPRGSLRRDCLEPCGTRTVCPWRGVATYYDVRVGDRIEPAAAWSYETPKRRARRIAGAVAFWKGIDVEP